jgi:RNA polymerase sigma-70 factor (ECF subfamily)
VPLSADILARARAGDERAQDALIAEYERGVARFVVMHTGSGPHCEDLCQNIFVKMLLALPRQQSSEAFEGWLMRIARNACIDHLRQRRGWRRLFVPFTRKHETIAAAAEVPQRRPVTSLAELAELPVLERSLLLQSLQGNKSYEELAQGSKLTVSAVKSRLFRARRRLAELVRKGEADEADED